MINTNPPKYSAVLFDERIPFQEEIRHLFTLGPPAGQNGETGLLWQIKNNQPDRIIVIDRFKAACASDDPTTPTINFNLFKGQRFVWAFPLPLKELMGNPIFESMTFLIPHGCGGNIVFDTEYNPNAETYLQFRVRDLDWRKI